MMQNWCNYDLCWQVDAQRPGIMLWSGCGCPHTKLIYTWTYLVQAQVSVGVEQMQTLQSAMGVVLVEGKYNAIRISGYEKLRGRGAKKIFTNTNECVMNMYDHGLCFSPARYLYIYITTVLLISLNHWGHLLPLKTLSIQKATRGLSAIRYMFVTAYWFFSSTSPRWRSVWFIIPTCWSGITTPTRME